MDKDEKSKARSYLVVKSNFIIQKTRFNMSLTEQRAIAYICSSILPENTLDNLSFEFNISRYGQICGLEKCETLYSDTILALKNLTEKSTWLEDENGNKTLIRWLSRVEQNTSNGHIQIEIDSAVAPYLIGLKNNFCVYRLQNILNFQSRYSTKLYEYLKSDHDFQVGLNDDRTHRQKLKCPKVTIFQIDIDKFRELFLLENNKTYQNFAILSRRVIEPALEEINKYTDISVNWNQVKRGKKVIGLQFYVANKSVEERAGVTIDNEFLLNKE